MRTKKVVRMPLRRNAQRTRPGSSLMPARAATAEEAYDEDEDYGGEDEPNMKFSHAVLVVLILHVIAVGGIFAFNSIKARQTSDAKASKAAATTAASTTAPAAATESETTAPEKTVAAAPAKGTDKVEPTKATTGKTHTIQAGDTLTRVATLYGIKVEDIEKENGITSTSMLHVGQVLKIPAGKSDAKTSTKTTAAAKPAPVKTTTEDTITTADKTVPDKPVPVATTTTEKATEKVTEKVDAPGAHGTLTGDTYVVVKGDNPYSIAKKFHISYNDLLTANGIKDATKIQIGQKLKIPAKK